MGKDVVLLYCREFGDVEGDCGKIFDEFIFVILSDMEVVLWVIVLMVVIIICLVLIMRLVMENCLNIYSLS